MDNTKQLKELLKNAINEGFSAADIASLAKDVEEDIEEEAYNEEWIDELQGIAADALADFLEALGYFDDDETTYEEDRNALYDSLQLVRDGKMKVNTESNTCSLEYEDLEKELASTLDRLKKLYL